MTKKKATPRKLTVPRRGAEYDHHYGLSLHGQGAKTAEGTAAPPGRRTASTRNRGK